MTAEGILARGRLNYEAGKFLDNAETMAYAETLVPSKTPPILDTKPKEEKSGKSKSR